MLTTDILDATSLSYLQPDEKSTILQQAEEIIIDAGTTLYQQGEKADCLHCILSGKIDITARDIESSQEFHITTINAGELIGESSLLENQTRSATATTKTRCRVLKISLPDDNTSISKIESQKKLHQALIKTLINRQQHTSQKLGKKILGINELSKMFLSTVVFICIYSFCLSFIAQNYLDIKFAILQNLIFSVVAPVLAITRIKANKLKLEDFGLSTNKFKPALIESMICAICITIIFLLLKLTGIFPHYQLYQPFAEDNLFKRIMLDNFWVAALTSFIFGFGQTIAIGAGMITSLRKILPYKHAGIIAALVSSLIMYTTLAHYGWYAPVYFFINSGIWMCLYLRHKTLYPIAILCGITYIMCVNVIGF